MPTTHFRAVCLVHVMPSFSYLLQPLKHPMPPLRAVVEHTPLVHVTVTRLEMATGEGVSQIEEGIPLLDRKGSIQNTERRLRHRCLLFGVVLLVVVLAAAVAVTVSAVVGVYYNNNPNQPFLYHHAAVAADAPQCSVVGVDILRKGGTAVDAAAASVLCLGVVNLHSTGIGGGGFMVFYNATSGDATVVDFREQAPSAAYMDMYSDDPMKAALGEI